MPKMPCLRNSMFAIHTIYCSSGVDCADPWTGPQSFLHHPLSLFQWFVCILAGLGSLVCYQLVLFIPICAKGEKTGTKRERQGKMGNQVERVGQPLLKLRSSGRKNSSIGRGSSVAHSYSVKEDRVSEIRRSGE